jgi:hypothetical protein
VGLVVAGPLVAALVVIPLADGARGLRRLGSRIVRWRVGWRWWGVAVSLPLVVLAVAAALDTGRWGAPAPDLGGLAWTSFLLAFAVRPVHPQDGPLGEEPA